MTTQNEVLDNPKYLPLLDYGFVGLTDSMGNDASIVKAARVSYGTGTKSVSEDRGLIRYLLRHHHSSPIEQVSFQFHIKIPIFVARQLLRHRTASANEYSARYSIMSDEFYLPDASHIEPQSTTNKQGRAGSIDDHSKEGVRWLMQTAYETSYATYKTLLGQRDEQVMVHYDPYGDNPLLTEEFPGIARELARTVLPVANYTECYWKSDLSNLFKLLKLRRDSHAQYEIRVLADAMYRLIQPIVPLACEAFTDYMMEAVTLSRMEVALLRDLLAKQDKITDEDAQAHGLTKREISEFRRRFYSD
jgi:thymidylate synthase (FAD)